MERPAEDLQAERHATRAWVPYFVVALSLAVTFLVAWLVHRAQLQQDRLRFNRASERTRIAVLNRIDTYASTLRNVVALFQTGGIPNRQQIHGYLGRLDIQGRYPGIQGIGFSVRVPAADREKFERVARENDVDPSFRIWPADPPRDEYHTIMYLVPMDERNRRALGFDMHSEPIRAAAMDAARDGGTATLSGKVQLVQEAATDDEPQSGFLLYMPLYKAKDLPATVDERRERLFGFIYAPFRADDLFRGTFAGDPYAQVDFRLYDGDAEDAAQLLHDTAAARARRASAADPAVATESSAAGMKGASVADADTKGEPRFTRADAVDVNGRRWTMRFASRPEFEAASAGWLVSLVLVSGVLVSATFFGLTRAQVRALAAGRRAVAKLERSEADVRRNEARFRRLAEANLVGVAFGRLNDHVIFDGNGEFLRMIGRSREEVAACRLRWDDLTAPDSREADERAVRQLAETGACTPYEKSFVRPDGSRVPVLIGAATLEGPDGEFFAVCVDITQRKQVERELGEAKDAAVAANRSKDRFLAVLSHELRTPLAPVLLAVSLWERNRSLPAELLGDFEMIRRNVELEARLIDDLLDLTRIGRGKLHFDLAPADAHAAVRHALEVGPAREAAEKGVTVSQRLDAAHATVSGDAARLQQAFWNLLHNAVKFTPAGGRVDVTSSNPAPNRLRVEVADTGIGIEPALLPMIFDAFEQGEAARSRASGGLGLGLAISRGLIEAHGGTVDVFSDGVGRGARFVVELPTAPAALTPGSERGDAPERSASTAASGSSRGDDAGGKGSPPAGATPPSNGGLRILMVEDHADSAMLLERLLRACGYDPHLADCVAAASRAGAAARFDLLLTDLSLPDGTGVDVLHALRRTQTNATIPAIALTGHGMPDDISHTEAAGFAFHLTKPIDLDRLRATIELAVRRNGREV